MPKRKLKLAVIEERKRFKPPFAPQPVSDLDMAFGGIDGIMPSISDIPEEFPNDRKWRSMFCDFFFCGAKDLKFSPKEGIDQVMAWRHVRTIMGSFMPKHEHKEAACSYLMSLWFDDITYTKGKS